MSHKELSRRGSRRPSFILVDKYEEDEISSSSVIGSIGIPALYIVAGATTLIGMICLATITKYWTTEISPPMCFLYAETPNRYSAAESLYHFGTNLSCCYWVSYGAIPAVFICVICGVIYVLHVKDDKDVTPLTYGVVFGVFVATLNMLAVACTLSQGLRMTCANIMMNPSSRLSRSCHQLLDSRVEGHNLPVQTSTMVIVSVATYWIGTISFMLITIFHIALLVRRTSAY